MSKPSDTEMLKISALLSKAIETHGHYLREYQIGFGLFGFNPDKPVVYVLDKTNQRILDRFIFNDEGNLESLG
jgi:hypothetical protein